MSEFRVFGPSHLAALAVTALATIALTVWVGREPERIARVGPALGVVLLGAGVGFVVVDTITGTSWRSIAPLHICDAAVFVGAYALFTRRQLACELLYFWGCAGTVPALVTPDLGENFPHHRFVFYFVQHGIIVVSAVVLAAGAQLRPRPGSQRIAWLWLNAYGVPIAIIDYLLGANFMYLCSKPGTATPLDWFGPWPWYVVATDALALGLFELLALPFRERDP